MNGRNTAYLIIAIGALISIGLMVLYLARTTELKVNASIDTDIFSSYGTLVGAILGSLFSLAGVFLLINTLEAQERAIGNQEANFRKQSFETRFFELIKMHRENSNAITVKNQMGKKVFLTLQREFYCCKTIVDSLNVALPKKLTTEEKINIAYQCFFFGAVGKSSEQILQNKLKAYEVILPVLLKDFKNYQKDFMRKENFQYLPFEGHQSRLAHYFRHLYQTTRYVNESQDLKNYEERYSYVKMLRAQLSTQEQVFLFLNSLSDLGNSWERKIDLPTNDRLITKYNLIKNIPTGYTPEIEVRNYFPLLRFEGDPLTEPRRSLERNYN